MNLYKKLLIPVVITLAFFFCLSFKPTTASAQFVPTLDSANLAQNTLLTNKELALDPIVTATAKIIIGNITNSIVTWINSGFQGNPAFVSDPESFFTDVGDQIAGNFIAGTELGFMCEPFSLDIRATLSISYSSTFTQRNYCRLSDVANNAQNFVKFTEGDFSQGGWNSWFEISQNAQNNALGAYMSANTELAIRTANGQAFKLKELDWGQGFLSYRECLSSNVDTGECAEYGPVQTPGSIIEKQLSNTLGSDLRQLELADEFNEIVGALTSQIVKRSVGLLSQGLSSYSPGSVNYGGYGNQSVQQPLSVSCFADKSRVAIGETVTWKAYVYGGRTGTITYRWGGDEIIGGTGDSVSVEYATTGIKTANVRITNSRDAQNLFGTCTTEVQVI